MAYCVYRKCLELECTAGGMAMAGGGGETMVRQRKLYEKAVGEHGSSEVGKCKRARGGVTTPPSPLSDDM